MTLIKKSAIYILMMCMLTACWSNVELNEIGIVTAIGIDYIDEEYVVSMQILNPSEIAQNGSSNQIPVFVYSMKADSVLEAVKKMSTLVSREIYIAHTRTVIVNEQLAENGISEILDFFTRYNEIRPDFFLLIAKDYRAEEIISILTPLEKIPANKMYTSLLLSEDVWSPTRGIKMNELINSLATKGLEPVLTGVTLYSSSNQSEGESESNVKQVNQYEDLQLTTLGVFKDDQLIGWLNERESIGLNYLKAEQFSVLGPINCQEGDKHNFTMEITGGNLRVGSTIQNGKPVFQTKVYVKAELAETSCRYNPILKNDLKKYQLMAEEELYDILVETFEAIKKYQSDFVGLGDLLKKEHPDYWAENEEIWQERLQDFEVELDIEVKIKRFGTTTAPYQFKQ
ncbi:Ger(x)C family spore germination protein [Alkalihalobacillus pseudalcaliphilus]|uniref:Ger(x)C family spore germination protein n=1 Tax=Alkalihalobacillus pseudalcaliphilus TaxID=79884 RepID=UPI00064DAB0F|nr:Ger(x)C family spore germination protein [Alkalihalobacillus pseudalcaliphilus]KMK76160.1 hypothetical protein AB990_13130 [Alkalihalobacillus pseudalcaliphilus]